MNFATTKDRILQYIDFKGIKIKKFYEETGIKRGFLDSDKLKSSVSDVFLAIIFANYPDINPIWLITGEGAMLKEPCPTVASSSQPQENDKYITSLEKQISLLEKNNALLEKENAYQAKEILLLEKEVSNLKKQTKSPTPAKVLEI